MKKLVDMCSDHNYIFIKRDLVVSEGNPLREIIKEVYACLDCGVGMDIYYLDEAKEISPGAWMKKGDL